MAKKDDDINNIFIIPPNFSDSGKVLGMVKMRNLIEAIIFSGIPGYFIWEYAFSYLGISVTIGVTIFVIVPIFIFCIVGINEDSLTIFLGNVLKYIKHHPKMRFKRIRLNHNIKRVQNPRDEKTKNSNKKHITPSQRGGNPSNVSRTRSR